ncbi:DegV family protein [Brevibacterium daeguense]|uniref:DegV family protein n=1 Tax=Brevibacterium daeguense TaxID=909936 RepID=A0ABP8EN45_9MICO|nr:DegV family protein [Brevibacterium daeguense]
MTADPSSTGPGTGGGQATPTGLLVDSTAQLSAERAAGHRAALSGLFGVVDLTVAVGDQERPDRDWSADEICAQMRAGTSVTTSLPGVEAFGEALDELIAAGAKSVLILTLPSVLSGTHSAAVAAAADYPDIEIHVIDSRTTSAGLAGAAAIGVAGIASGMSAASVAGEIEDWCAAETRTFFIPEDLEYLRRGGRIGTAASLLGRALAITPVLGLRAGSVVPLARVRTAQKAHDRLVRLVAETCAEFTERDSEVRLEVVVQHPESTPGAAGKALQRVLDLLAHAELHGDPEIRTEVLSTVITAHVGPGALGVTVQTRP